MPSSKAATREEVGTLRYVEPLIDARMPLADFLSILLEVHPELGIGPILVDAGTKVLRDIRAGEEVTIAGLEG